MQELTRLLVPMCILAAAPVFAHFDHEDPQPHALQSEFVELRTEIRDARVRVNDSIRRVEEQVGENAVAVAAIASLSDAVAALDDAVTELDAKCCPDPDDDAWLELLVGGGAGALFGIGGVALFGRRLLRLPKTPPAPAPVPATSPRPTSAPKAPTESEKSEEEGDADSEPALRTVTASRRDDDGIILAICNHDEPWRERTVVEAIADMKSGIVYESLGPQSGRRARVRYVERRGARPYLTTEGDDAEDNNLDNLPPC
ncbi:MAG: DUF3892 domain-containing protein [Gammaproteobacteria bacterium]|nr:DUF3892 domain-containing protein [Gammaproteobacteria bacterium]